MRSSARTDLPRRAAPLSTARLHLEPLGPQHAPRLFAVFGDTELYRFVPQDAYATVAALRNRYRHVARGPAAADERWWNWAAIARDAAAPALGTVEVTLLEGGRRALLAYMFGRAFWGRGLAYEACRAVCDHLAGDRGVAHLEAFIDTRNTRSLALVERLGFVYENRVENADYFKGSASHEFHYRRSLEKDDHGETLRR